LPPVRTGAIQVDRDVITMPRKMPDELTESERRLLWQCAHPVAQCPRCGRDHRPETVLPETPQSRRYDCPDCGADITEPLRAHLLDCAEVAIRRASASAASARATHAASRRLREAAQVTRIQSAEIFCRALKERLTRSSPACSICGATIKPEEPVAFEHGDLFHLVCHNRAAS
jgi:transcription elongation factor Elf1